MADGKGSSQRSASLDLLDLNGLRGVAAVWVMVSHCFAYKAQKWKLLPSTLMPLFFLLSGFTLAIAYHDSKGSWWRDFLYNRVVRTTPVYWICLVLAIPLTAAGFGMIDPTDFALFAKSLVTSSIPVSTWGFGGRPLNAPGWTMATLWFFWVLFPTILGYLKKFEDRQLLRVIQISFLLQMGLFFVFYTLGMQHLPSIHKAFTVATIMPYSRIFVFIMGVAAGILCRRYKDKPSETLPWFQTSGNFFPVDWINPLGPPLQGDKVNFTGNAVMQSVSILILTLIFSVWNTFSPTLNANAWFQIFNIWAQLDIMICLVQSRGTTSCSHVLRHPVVLWLGDLSMSIYLVHWPIIYTLTWLAHGSSLPWPAWKSVADMIICAVEDASFDNVPAEVAVFLHNRKMPEWGLLVVPVVSIFCAWILFQYVEEPVRKAWKSKGKKAQ